jgi:hypothetical protein
VDIPMMREYRVSGGVFSIYMPDPPLLPHGKTVFVFDDGAVSTFVPPFKPDFLQAAVETGYGEDFASFGLEHDAMHVWLAHCLGWPCSPVIWKQAHGDLPPWQPKGDVWPFHPDGWDEEHICISLQRYLRTGKVDEECGVLHGLWGERGLVMVAAGFVNWLSGADPDNVPVPPVLPEAAAKIEAALSETHVQHEGKARSLS